MNAKVDLLEGRIICLTTNSPTEFATMIAKVDWFSAVQYVYKLYYFVVALLNNLFAFNLFKRKKLIMTLTITKQGKETSK